MGNTAWCGLGDGKLYLQSGQFSSTIKTSLAIGAVDTGATGISWDGTNTPWCGWGDDKLYLQSGQFSSTLKTSLGVTAVDNTPTGISWDGTDTPWCGEGGNKLYLQSGQFSSTLKTSLNINAVDNNPTGITWDGTNTPWCGYSDDKLYLQSGQFSSTMKTSLAVGTVDTFPTGIGHGDIDERFPPAPSHWAKILVANPANIAANDYCKLTANDVTGRSYAETKTDLSLNLVENTAHSTDAHTMTIDGRDVSVDGTKLDGIEALADVTATAETSHADVVVDGDFTSNGLLNRTGAGSYSIKAIGTDVQAYHANLAAIAGGTWTGAASITTLGTIATGTWQATDVGISYGGTGQSTAQLAINALSAVSGATNEHVLTKDTATGNAVFKAAAGGGGAGGGVITWFGQQINSVTQGTWGVVLYSGSPFYFTYANATHADGDEIHFSGFMGAGTYTCKLHGQRNTNQGIVKIYIDADLVATFDKYGATDFTHVFTQTSISVASSGVKDIKYVIDGAHGSSSNHYGHMTFLSFYRTS